MAFVAPSLTQAQMVTLIASATGLDETNDVTLIDQAMTEAGFAASVWNRRGWWWSRSFGQFDTGAGSISKVARTTNVATLTTAAAHGLIANNRIKVSGVTLAGFDVADAAVVAAPTTTTLTYANTGTNVVEVADATGAVYGHTYPIRTVNSAAMPAFFAPLGLWYSESRRLAVMDKADYDNFLATSDATGPPGSYAVSSGVALPYFHIWPLPDSAYTIYVSYIKQHSKLTAGTGDLTVPEEFHYGVYVNGAVELLQGQHLGDPWYLHHSKKFRDCMGRMALADPQKWDANSDLGGGLGLPPDLKVFSSIPGAL